MNRDEMIRSVKGALINLRFPLDEITQSKITVVLEDRIPESQVIFGEDSRYYITGSVVVEDEEPIQFKVAKDIV